MDKFVMLGTVTGKTSLYLTKSKSHLEILNGIAKGISDDISETGQLKQLVLWAIDHYLKKDHDSQTDELAFFFGQKRVIKTWKEKTTVRTILLQKVLGSEGRKIIEIKRLRKIDDDMELAIDITVTLGELERTDEILKHVCDIPSARIQDAHLLSASGEHGK